MNIKLVDEASQMPKRAHEFDAGADLFCRKVEFDKNTNIVTYYTGVCVEIPAGFVGLVCPRSSIYKTGQSMCNSVGVIDSGYTGEITVKTYLVENEVNNAITYKVGERVAQLLLLPISLPKFVQVDELEKTERGDSGYGSTGK